MCVTIVVTPRERYSTALRCLPTLIANTKMPHRLVYVAGNAPAYIVKFLETTCRAHRYELELRPRFLSPNEARNIGVRLATTRYVALLDNDVLVEPGWLEALVKCAEETGADIVGPLVLWGEPEDGLVHIAGGDLLFEEENGRRRIDDRHRHTDANLRIRPLELTRSRCDYVDAHCLLARRDLFDRIGLLDERTRNLEHIDLALALRDHGGNTVVEPTAVVSYLVDADHVLSDAEFFQVRGSEDWLVQTLGHWAQKWRFDPESSLFRRFIATRPRQQEICQLPRPGVQPPGEVTAHHHPFAQTVLQLASHMRSLGYPVWNIEAVLAAYHVAALLFDGIYRANGKTFVAHAVGTASVLAAYGAPATVIVAGLLHAAYPLGRFPANVGGTLAGTRRWLSHRIGHRAEAQVFEYFRLDFETTRAAVLETDPDELRLLLAYAVLLQMANSVDEHLDGGLLFTRDAPDAVARSAAQNARWSVVYRRVAALLRCESMLDLLLSLQNEVSRGTFEYSPPPLAASYVFASESRQALARVADRAPAGAARRQARIDQRPLLERLRPTPGPLLRQFGRDEFILQNGGVIRREGPGLVTLVTGPLPWSYSCLLPIDPADRLQGEVILKVAVSVSEGRLGVAVLWKNSSTEFLGPEQSVDVGGPVELRFALPEVREAGHLVFRSWVPQRTTARIADIAVHSVAD